MSNKNRNHPHGRLTIADVSPAPKAWAGSADHDRSVGHPRSGGAPDEFPPTFAEFAAARAMGLEAARTHSAASGSRGVSTPSTRHEIKGA